MKRLLLVPVFAALVLLLPGCEPPPTGGFYTTKAVDTPLSALPSGAECKAQIYDRRTGWEPRPDNEDENGTTPPSDFHLVGYAGMDQAVWDRVKGNFTGTTDEVIQWAACKWGLSDNVLRAQAVVESNWHMSQVGDAGSCSQDPSSIGIFQIKWCQHPGTRAYSRISTPFNADYDAAVIRGCIGGHDYVVGGELWGCIGRWYSGGWHDSGANNYIGLVQDELAQKDWLQWSG